MRTYSLLIILMFGSISCQLLDNSVRGTGFTDGSDTIPLPDDQPPIEAPIPISTKLQFTGSSSSSTKPSLRSFDDNSTGQWSITGDCDKASSSVTLSSIDLNTDIVVVCSANGTFSSSVNYLATDGTPFFNLPPDQTKEIDILATQTTRTAEMRLFRSGTTTPVHFVTTLSDLQTIPMDSNRMTVFNNDFDLTQLVSIKNNWVPLGSSGTPFRGELFGEGHNVRNLNIDNTSGSNLGFFGYIDGAKIHDLNLIDLTVIGLDFVGGLAAQTLAGGMELESITVTGHLTATNGSLGGIAGATQGLIMKKSSFKGSLFGGTGDKVGGLVGLMTGSMIQECDVVAHIQSSGDKIGGLAGNSDNTTANVIFASLFAGNISGGNQVGGFVGLSSGGDSNFSPLGGKYLNLKHSYANGKVTMTGANGGALVGHNSDTSTLIEDAYFSSDAGCTGTCGSTQGTAKTIDELSLQATFTNWDFVNSPTDGSNDNWKMPLTPGPPISSWREATPRSAYCWEQARFLNPTYANFGAATIDGTTSDKAFTICSAAQMNTIGLRPADWGAYFKLADDINLGVFKITDYNVIGDISTFYTGDFNGLGYTISNFFYDDTSTDAIGLFGFSVGGLVHELSVINSHLKGSSECAILIGESSSSGLTQTAENVFVTGTVVATGFRSGLILGRGEGLLNSIAIGDMTTGRYAGGLAGESPVNPIVNSLFVGNVTATGFPQAGFIVGNTSAVVTNSFYDDSFTCTSSTVCPMEAGGTDTSATPNPFFSKSTPPLSSWNFTQIWQENSFTYPTLIKHPL